MTTLQLIGTGNAPAAAPIMARLSATIHNLAETIRFRKCMARDLAVLRARDPHMLADIGLSRFHLMPDEAQEALYRKISRHS